MVKICIFCHNAKKVSKREGCFRGQITCKSCYGKVYKRGLTIDEDNLPVCTVQCIRKITSPAQMRSKIYGVSLCCILEYIAKRIDEAHRIDGQVDSLASNFNYLTVHLPKVPQLAPPMVKLEGDNQSSHLYYSALQLNFGLQSQLSLQEDLKWIEADLAMHGFRVDFSRLIIMASGVDVHLLSKPYDYELKCCQLGSSSTGNSIIYHSLFDFLVRVGWLDPISPEEASSNQFQICSANHAVNLYGFAYCVNTYKLNPSGLHLNMVRAIANQFDLPDPTKCKFCHQRFSQDGAHVTSNLLLLLGLSDEEKLRAFSTCNCTYKQKNEPQGVPIRARDLLDFFVFSGLFIVYGPPMLPPNYWYEHSPSADVVTRQCQQFGFLNPDQLPDDQICFVFCRRRTGNANATYFGTKNRVYVGVTTFSVSSFQHWYFVPRIWHQPLLAIEHQTAAEPMPSSNNFQQPALDEFTLNTP